MEKNFIKKPIVTLIAITLVVASILYIQSQKPDLPQTTLILAMKKTQNIH